MPLFLIDGDVPNYPPASSGTMMRGRNSVICGQNIMATISNTKEKKKTKFHFMDFIRGISAIVHANSCLIP